MKRISELSQQCGLLVWQVKLFHGVATFLDSLTVREEHKSHRFQPSHPVPILVPQQVQRDQLQRPQQPHLSVDRLLDLRNLVEVTGSNDSLVIGAVIDGNGGQRPLYPPVVSIANSSLLDSTTDTVPACSPPPVSNHRTFIVGDEGSRYMHKQKPLQHHHFASLAVPSTSSCGGILPSRKHLNEASLGTPLATPLTPAPATVGTPIPMCEEGSFLEAQPLAMDVTQDEVECHLQSELKEEDDSSDESTQRHLVTPDQAVSLRCRLVKLLETWQEGKHGLFS